MRKLCCAGLALLLAAIAGMAAAAAPDGGARIVDFVYERGGYPDKAYCFNVYQEDGEVYLAAMGYNGADLDEMRRVDETVFDGIMEIVERYDLYAWNGFDQVADVMDGHMFSLGVEFDDGTEIYAKGHEMYPDNYQEADEAIMRFFFDKLEELETIDDEAYDAGDEEAY